MAAERQTPPPIPRARKRHRNVTQELKPAELEKIDGVVDLARILLKQRIANAKDAYGKPCKPDPGQIKLQVRIEISKIREGEPKLTIAQYDKIGETVDVMLRQANIVR